MADSFEEALAQQGLSLDQFDQPPQQQGQQQAPQQQRGPQPKVTAAAPASFEEAMGAQGFDVDDFLTRTSLPDGKPRPKYADGLSPKTAIPKSPLGMEERFTLNGLGNEKGILKALQQRFEAVERDADGDYSVREKGVWYKMDGSAFGDADSWKITQGIVKGTMAAAQFLGDKISGTDKLTKKYGASPTTALTRGDDVASEVAGEIVENAPMAATVAAGAATGFLTGGLSIPAQVLAAGGTAAALELGRTSWGRLEGTYEASPEEQVKDVAVESILNAAGVFIPVGTKWGAAQFGKAFPQVGAALGAMSDGTVTALKRLYSGITGRSGEAIDTLIEQRDAVGKVIKHVGKSAKTPGEFVDLVKGDTVELVKQASEEVAELPGEVYRKQQAPIIKGVSDNFTGGVNDAVDSVILPAVHDGLVQIRQKGVYRSTGEVVKKGRLLTQAEAVELIAENGGKLPEKGFHFVPASKDAITDFVRKTGDLSNATAGLDDEAYGMMSGFFKQLIGLRGTVARRGPEGAKQALELNKVLGDMTQKLRVQGKESATNLIERRMAAYHEVIEKQFHSRFEKEGLGEAFTGLNSTYRDMQMQMLPFLNAAKRAEKLGDGVFEELSKKLASRAGSNLTARKSFPGALALAEKYGSARAKTLRELQQRVRVNDAALEFYPPVPSGLLSQGFMTFSAGSLATGNPAPALVAAAGAAIRSPRVGYHTINALDAAWQFKEMLQKMGKDGVRRFSENPTLVNAAVSAVVESPLMQEHVKEKLLTPIRGPRQQ